VKKEVIVCKKRFPNEGEVETFQFITFNYQEKRVILEQEQDFQAVVSRGFVGNIQGSANNRFIHIQLILPHKLKSGYLFLLNSNIYCYFRFKQYCVCRLQYINKYSKEIKGHS